MLDFDVTTSGVGRFSEGGRVVSSSGSRPASQTPQTWNRRSGPGNRLSEAGSNFYLRVDWTPAPSDRPVLNLGCGNQTLGDIRADMSVTDTTNVICDMAGVLPFKGNAVGTVYTRCVFEHLTNPGLFLNEVRRILKPGGRLLLITDNAAYWRYHVSMRFGRYSIGMPHAAHVTAYNMSDRHFGLYLVGHLRQHADRAGLLVRELKLVDFEERGSAHLLDRILRRVPHLSAFSYPRIYLFATKPSGR